MPHNSPMEIIIKQEIDEGMDVKKKDSAFTHMSLLWISLQCPVQLLSSGTKIKYSGTATSIATLLYKIKMPVCLCKTTEMPFAPNDVHWGPANLYPV